MLEYGSPVWSPWYKKDITELEKVQSRCLKLSSDPISLPELITRRQEQDMCEVYKFMRGLYKTSYDNYFQKPFRTHIGHSLKLFKPQCKTNVRQNFFSQRVIDMWNSLPEEVMSAPWTHSKRTWDPCQTAKRDESSKYPSIQASDENFIKMTTFPFQWWMKGFVLWFEFNRSMFLRMKLTILQHWFG